MANESYIVEGDVKALLQKFEEAYGQFNSSFNELENGINALTQKSYYGTAAIKFKESFQGQPKDALDAVKNDTRNAIEYLERETGIITRGMNEIDEISYSNR